MKYYMAPLEGITTHIFRQVYSRHYPDFDKYFTPFIASTGLSAKERNEILPENNIGRNTVPQILANHVDTFLKIAEQLRSYGYDVVNINLGCPSGTVVSRKRGSGQLRDTEALDRFLDELFEKCPLKISIKTRIGMVAVEEWESILEVYKRYPLEELIIHPRLREDYYNRNVRQEAFDAAYGTVDYPLCYNGDVFNIESAEEVINKYPGLSSIMIGRGILRTPQLLGEIRARESGTEYMSRAEQNSKMLEFIFDLTDSYEQHYGIGQDRNVLFKVKDVWNHLGLEFTSESYLQKAGLEREDVEKGLKAIRKSETITAYKIAVRKFFGML